MVDEGAKFTAPFGIGDLVQLKPLDILCKIKAVFFYRGFVEFRISYWFDGKRFVEDVGPEELRKIV